MAKLKIVIWYFLGAFSTSFALECAHRSYGHGSSVCVCNATYCDNLQPIANTAKGVITAFVTSSSGDRFAKSELHFVKNSSKKVDSGLSVTIDYNRKYQKIIGFGGAFTDAAGLNIAKLPNEMQDRLIRDYFANDGIEYTLGRIPIGGCDFSTRPYSYDDNPGDETLSKFALQPEDLNYKIPYLKLAQQVSPHKVNYFGSPWSSPAWMKTNNEINHGGMLIGDPGGKYYKMWAKYFVRFLEEYTKQNVSIWSITVENEPGAGLFNDTKWNSLGFYNTTERDFLKMDLGPELHRHGYTNDKLKVMVFDGQLPYATDFVSAIMDDKDAAKYVSGVAFHWYYNWKANWSDIDYLYQKYPGTFMLASEACEEHHGMKEHVSLGNWSTFNRYSDDIFRDLNHYTAGWVDWNIVLDLQGGPNWADNYVDAPIIVNATSHEYYKQPFFYAMGHFSKFLVPDSIRIHHEATELNNTMVTVFQRPDNGTVVIILNKNPDPIVVQIHDPLNGHVDVNVKAEAIASLIWY